VGNHQMTTSDTQRSISATTSIIWLSFCPKII
jgi:hypothetical protein